MAIAVSAEYGEVWPTAISLIGSSCSRSWCASRSHAGQERDVADLADAPAARATASRTAARAGRRGGRASATSAIHQARDSTRLEEPRRSLAERGRLGEQAHDEVRLAWEVEEVAGVHEHPVPLEQLERPAVPRDGWPARGRPRTSRLRRAGPSTRARPPRVRAARQDCRRPLVDQRAEPRGRLRGAVQPRAAPAWTPRGTRRRRPPGGRAPRRRRRRRAARRDPARASSAAGQPTSTGRPG